MTIVTFKASAGIITIMSLFKTEFLLGFIVCNALTTLRECVKITDCGVLVCLLGSTLIKIACAASVKILVVKILVFLFNVIELKAETMCSACNSRSGLRGVYVNFSV